MRLALIVTVDANDEMTAAQAAEQVDAALRSAPSRDVRVVAVEEAPPPPVDQSVVVAEFQRMVADRDATIEDLSKPAP